MSQDDDDINVEQKDAASLHASDLMQEMMRFGIQPTGVVEQNISRLQDKYDEEYTRLNDAKMKLMGEKKRSQESQRRREQTAQHMKEEMEALEMEPKAELWFNLALANRTPEHGGLSILTPVTSRALARVLAVNCSLISLDLSRSQVGEEGGAAVAHMLHTNKRLRKLELENCGLGCRAAVAFGNALVENCMLQFLSLQSNTLTESPHSDKDFDLAGVIALGKMLTVNCSLTTLIFSNIGLGAEGGRELSRAMLSNQSVLILDVGQNGVGLLDQEAITRQLETNKRAKEEEDSVNRSLRAEAKNRSEEKIAQMERERKMEEQEKWHEEQAAKRREKREKEKESRLNQEAEMIKKVMRDLESKDFKHDISEVAEPKDKELLKKKGGKKGK